MFSGQLRPFSLTFLLSVGKQSGRYEYLRLPHFKVRKFAKSVEQF